MLIKRQRFPNRSASAKYHQEKADLLIFRQQPQGYTPEMLGYEMTLESALQEPDDDMVDLMLLKLDFLTQQRLAFTEWDEGNGACGHPFSKERRLNSIPMYLDAVKTAIEYSNKSSKLSSTDGWKKSQYYGYEAKVGEYFANTYLSWVEGMANWNFEDERVKPLSEKEREELSASYKEILNVQLSEKPAKIDEYLKLYNSKI